MNVLDLAQAAAELRCAESTVQEHARTGKLPGVKFGDSWIFPADAFYKRLSEIAIEESERRRTPRKAPAVAYKGTGYRKAPPSLPTLPV